MNYKDIVLYFVSLAVIITIIIWLSSGTVKQRRIEHGFHRCWIGSSFFDGRYEWRTDCNKK